MPTNWILGENFHKIYPHLTSVRALWELKWSFPAKLAVYPFHDGQLSDFQPIFEKLIADGVNDAYSDEYTEYFLPTARKLTEQAMNAQASGGKEGREKAIELFKRAACVLRISRFPSIDASGPEGLKRKVWEEQKMVYLRGAGLWGEVMKEVVIEHVHAKEGEGREVPLFVRLPKGVKEGVREGNGCPVVLLATGLDGHRPDNTGVSSFAFYF
jgi:hypothetical protein